MGHRQSFNDQAWRKNIVKNIGNNSKNNSKKNEKNKSFKLSPEQLNELSLNLNFGKPPKQPQYKPGNKSFKNNKNISGFQMSLTLLLILGLVPKNIAFPIQNGTKSLQLNDNNFNENINNFNQIPAPVFPTKPTPQVSSNSILNNTIRCQEIIKNATDVRAFKHQNLEILKQIPIKLCNLGEVSETLTTIVEAQKAIGQEEPLITFVDDFAAMLIQYDDKTNAIQLGLTATSLKLMKANDLTLFNMYLQHELLHFQISESDPEKSLVCGEDLSTKNEPDFNFYYKILKFLANTKNPNILLKLYNKIVEIGDQPLFFLVHHFNITGQTNSSEQQNLLHRALKKELKKMEFYKAENIYLCEEFLTNAAQYWRLYGQNYLEEILNLMHKIYTDFTGQNTEIKPLLGDFVVEAINKYDKKADEILNQRLGR